jgi:hypothetical protein
MKNSGSTNPASSEQMLTARSKEKKECHSSDRYCFIIDHHFILLYIGLAIELIYSNIFNVITDYLPLVD